MKTKLAIVNRTKIHGTIDGVIHPNDTIRSLIALKLKENKAKKLIDNDETLMYRIID